MTARIKETPFTIRVQKISPGRHQAIREGHIVRVNACLPNAVSHAMEVPAGYKDKEIRGFQVRQIARRAPGMVQNLMEKFRESKGFAFVQDMALSIADGWEQEAQLSWFAQVVQSQSPLGRRLQGHTVEFSQLSAAQIEDRIRRGHKVLVRGMFSRDGGNAHGHVTHIADVQSGHFVAQPDNAHIPVMPHTKFDTIVLFKGKK